jgi:hypothetical protein
MIFVPHHRQICARLSCINGNRMSALGVGWIAMVRSANKVLGPHSLECGIYVKLCALIHSAS